MRIMMKMVQPRLQNAVDLTVVTRKYLDTHISRIFLGWNCEAVKRRLFKVRSCSWASDIVTHHPKINIKSYKEVKKTEAELLLSCRAPPTKLLKAHSSTTRGDGYCINILMVQHKKCFLETEIPGVKWTWTCCCQILRSSECDTLSVVSREKVYFYFYFHCVLI